MKNVILIQKIYLLRFDLMVSYGEMMGPIFSVASLFCMFLYFVTTVDSGR